MRSSGFLVINKPAGPTSFDVVAQVRRELKVKKVGHLGTLDPLATGVLVLAVGQGTKLIEYFMGADKQYEAQLELGKVSDTYDVEGEIESVDFKEEVTREILEAVLQKFRGEIQQIPPAHSAIKVNGKRAYALARAGQNVELKARPVTIHGLELIDFEWPTATLKISCSSGTYIRSLIHDVGQKLNCGAVMTALRRDSVGGFGMDRAVELESVSQVDLIPLERVVQQWPRIDLNSSEFEALHQGKFIKPPEAFSATLGDPIVAFFEGQLVSVVDLVGGWLKPTKNFPTPS